MYVIPGYASGVFHPHEVPSRGQFLPETGRTVTSRSTNDGRIHFIDPLTNSFDDSAQRGSIPQPGLLPPPSFGSNDFPPNASPIDIPKPNIDQPEAPPLPAINDPLDQPLFPPVDDKSAGIGQPSIDLQLPGSNANAGESSRRSISSSASNGIDIPRPNLDAPETPIDTSNGPLNVGLLPPDFKPVGSATDFNSQAGSDTRRSDQGTIFFNTGDVVFAPKPSTGKLRILRIHYWLYVVCVIYTFRLRITELIIKLPQHLFLCAGLLPPKDPSQIDSNFNFNTNFNPTTTSAPTINKFTGSFGGSSGVLGGRPSLIAANNRVNSNNNNFGQFPVATSSQDDATTARTTTANNNRLPAAAVRPSSANKFTGSFGGPPGKEVF